jgi:hypothetical protein
MTMINLTLTRHSLYKEKLTAKYKELVAHLYVPYFELHKPLMSGRVLIWKCMYKDPT